MSECSRVLLPPPPLPLLAAVVSLLFPRTLIRSVGGEHGR
jgi:hypothetical protein